MARLRGAAVAGPLLAGAAVAMAGVIGFIGLTAPHIRAAAKRKIRANSSGPRPWPAPCCPILADLAARLIPTDEELKLGVVTALFSPAFALIAWRSARSRR